MSNNYKDYFITHYQYLFTDEDIKNYRKWFFAQWMYINSIEKIDCKKNILEIGSAIGGFYSFLDERQCNNYLGIEIDNSATKFASKTYANTKFKTKSLEELATRKKYSYIFGFEVLEHFQSPKDSIHKIHKLLDPQGKFIGTSPYPYLKNIWGDKTHNFVLHPDNWKKLFLDEGFGSVETYPMSFLPFIWRLNKNLNIKLPFYIPFKHFISTTLIIAQK